MTADRKPGPRPSDGVRDLDAPGALDDLGDRLAKGRDAAGLSKPLGPTRSESAVGDGLRIAIEFVVSTLVGAGLGYFIGGLLGSAVIGLLVGLLLGFGAGLRGVYRGMMVGQEPATKPDAKSGRSPGTEE